ncbi:cobalt ECF transporter T component CbiQ [Egicoccus sp. AB-alg6-2]|uniref:cobalt ECF transporter T component CbiQ n=1 Tax=Egicoccus sp. AB-alg6-2 TaxID=3242692 RepID=UPI00359CC4EE
MGAGHAHALYVHEHSPVHALPPHVKVVAAFGTVVTIAVTPAPAWPVFAVAAVVLGGVAVLARVPLRFVATRLLVVVPFLLVAVMVPFVASGSRVTVLGLEVSRAGIVAGFGIASRAVLGATASILLAATTEVPRLLRALERLRVPPVLTQIATFMVRYLEVVAGELGRMRTAMVARGHDPRWLWQARPVAAASGALFVRSYERGERVYAAMLARGYAGTMPDLHDEEPVAAVTWSVALALPAVVACTLLLWWLRP